MKELSNKQQQSQEDKKAIQILASPP